MGISGRKRLLSPAKIGNLERLLAKPTVAKAQTMLAIKAAVTCVAIRRPKPNFSSGVPRQEYQEERQINAYTNDKGKDNTTASRTEICPGIVSR